MENDTKIPCVFRGNSGCENLGFGRLVAVFAYLKKMHLSENSFWHHETISGLANRCWRGQHKWSKSCWLLLRKSRLLLRLHSTFEGEWWIFFASSEGPELDLPLSKRFGLSMTDIHDASQSNVASFTSFPKTLSVIFAVELTRVLSLRHKQEKITPYWSILRSPHGRCCLHDRLMHLKHFEQSWWSVW